MPTIDFGDTLEEQCAAIWAATRANEAAEFNIRKVPPVVLLWDGEMNLQHIVQAEYAATFELVDGDTGSFEIRHPFDHPCGLWLYDEKGRLARGEKRNINVTVEYCGSRFGGMLENLELEIDDDGNQIVVARFASDYERLKWYTVWSNPWLPEWIQWPQVFIIAGPITWILSAMLEFQLHREMGSSWTLPSDPLNPASRGSLNQSTWSMVVKPISFVDAMASGVVWSICASRFKNFHDLAKTMYEDGEITPVITVWLEGDPDPWPDANLRHGTRIVSFEDRSGVLTGTSHGGTIFDGLIRAFMEFAGDFIDSTESIITDGTIPPEYYEVGSKRTQKELPFVVWRDGEETGLESYRYRKTPSKGIQVVTGGHSMPGVNELISACVAGETIIQGPDGDERIDVLAARGEPFRVWALTPAGEHVVATATHAFLKGQAELFEYVLGDGRSIKATKQHRFLSRDGWTRAVDIRVGAEIATLNQAALPGGEFDQRAREVDDDEYRNLPTTESLTFLDVVEVRPLGPADYYDMTVPALKNYAAQGIWNHNTIQMAGDLIAAMLFVPPVGGAADAILAPLYTDALLAWMVARSTARANNQGWTRYFEYFQEGSNKAYTISSLMVLRAGMWATRSYDASTFSAGDGAPFLVGEGGHVWLGDRAGYTIRQDPTGRIYMDRVSKVGLSWSRDEAATWTITIGDDRALQDPVARAWERIEAIVSSLQQLGVF